MSAAAADRGDDRPCSHPIPPAMESNRLMSSSGTCDNCHSRQKFASAKLRVIPDYAVNESNTPSQTVLTMRVGGSKQVRQDEAGEERFRQGSRRCCRVHTYAEKISYDSP